MQILEMHVYAKSKNQTGKSLHHQQKAQSMHLYSPFEALDANKGLLSILLTHLSVKAIPVNQSQSEQSPTNFILIFLF